MAWFYVDDAFADSKPVMALDAGLRNEAIGLWTRCGAWSAKEETDGSVPMDVVKGFGGSPRLIIALHSQAHLWTENTSESWRVAREILFKSWEKWQPTHAELEQERVENSRKRSADAARKRAERAAKNEPEPTHTYRRHKGRNVVLNSENTDSDTESSEKCPTGQVTDTDRTLAGACVRPDPTRPDHIDTTTANAVVVPRKRGTRLAPDWMPSQAVREAMQTECPTVDFRAEHRKFIDYWTDRTGKDATKVSWDGTWRNWIRRAAEQTPNRRDSTNGQLSTMDDKVNGWMNMPIPNSNDPKELLCPE